MLFVTKYLRLPRLAFGNNIPAITTKTCFLAYTRQPPKLKAIFRSVREYRTNTSYPRVSYIKIHKYSTSKISGLSDNMTEVAHEVRKRGAFIVFEGVDRCGKTSQTKMLVEHLKSQGVETELWNFPDRTTEIGKMINAYLKNSAELDDHVIHLLFSANRWEKSSLMEEKLRAGITLIMDRYAFSGQAFSAAKGMDLEWCKAPDKGLLAPDAVIHLHIEIEEATNRGGFGEERYETVELQTKVAENFVKLGGQLGASWITVNGARTPENVQAEVRQKALEIIDSITSESIFKYFE
mmetsp:Transcript_28757/g.39755  ORF Transcript_28757/g.39755 Transcript_28757/m.39755 type:complete len:294 (-) Transcript_28757:120-1001(-)